MSGLEKGKKAVVLGVCADGGASIYKRLRDVGFIKGTDVTCVNRGPRGGIAAFMLRGTVIALRSEDSSRISIKRVD